MILQIMGRLGKDPEMRYMPDGTAVVNFSVVENRKYSLADGTQGEKVWWFRCSMFGKRAEAIREYFKKGSGIYVIGELIPDEHGGPRMFTREDGTVGTSFEIRVSDWKFLPCPKEDLPVSNDADEDFNYDEDGGGAIPFI